MKLFSNFYISLKEKCAIENVESMNDVSYTHLTLPTICSV